MATLNRLRLVLFFWAGQRSCKGAYCGPVHSLCQGFFFIIIFITFGPTISQHKRIYRPLPLWAHQKGGILLAGSTLPSAPPGRHRHPHAALAFHLPHSLYIPLPPLPVFFFLSFPRSVYSPLLTEVPLPLPSFAPFFPCRRRR